MQARPDTTKETIRAGPVRSWAAWPVKTKIPVPMTAPTPRAESWTGPSTRRRRFSPFISSYSIESGLRAKSWLVAIDPPIVIQSLQPSRCAGRPECRGDCGAPTPQRAPRPPGPLEVLDLRHQAGQGSLGVSEEHRRLGIVEQLVLDAREPGVHAPLEHDDVVRLVHVQDRHNVDRT